MSLLVDVAKALENMKAHEMPSAHRLVWLMYAQHANERNSDRAWPSLARLHDETGYGRTKLSEVIADLVDHGFLVPDGNVGEGLHRSARYVVKVEGRRWPEDSRAKLARSTARATAARTAHVPPGGKAVYRRADSLRTADLESGNRAAVTNLPVTHQINPPDQPTIAPAQARAGDPPAPGQVPLFGASPGATPPPATEEQPKGGKAPKAQDRYLAAFVAGIEDAGHRITLPPSSHGTQLGRICASHARRGDTAIVGDELVAWIRREVCAFRKAIDPRYCKVSVHGFGEWLDKGRPVHAPTFRPSEVDDFNRPRESDSWPEAQLVPDPEPRPDPHRGRERTPEEQRQIAELAKLGIAELERRAAAAPGLAGWR